MKYPVLFEFLPSCSNGTSVFVSPSELPQELLPSSWDVQLSSTQYSTLFVFSSFFHQLTLHLYSSLVT